MTKIKIPGFELDNPIIPASGTFGYGYEFNDYYDLNILGAFSIKGTTLKSKFGNPTPRIAEVKQGMINSIGLQNPGVDNVINEEFKKLNEVYNKKVFANISGNTIEEYVEISKKFDQCEIVGGLEINISCPNVKQGGITFGTDKDLVFELISAIKKETTKPVYVKLSPNVTSIEEIAISCEKAGADGLVLINTLIGMKIDIKKRKPVLANKKGGFSGPAIKPVAIKAVYDVYNVVSIPIIGCGGIMDAYDVIEFMLAGASAVQVGSLNLIDPYGCQKIIKQLPEVMKELEINNLEEIIGGSHE